MRLRELAATLHVTDDLWTNDQRAVRAGAVVKEYSGSSSDAEADVQDFLADLQHYCDAAGLDYESLCARAARHHEVETNAEGLARKTWEDE